MSKRINYKLWEQKYRPKVKSLFYSRGITYCELRLQDCKGSAFLSFAHSLPRREIKTEEQMMEVILTCNNCHQIIEGNLYDKTLQKFWSREDMYNTVKEIISKRHDY